MQIHLSFVSFSLQDTFLVSWLHHCSSACSRKNYSERTLIHRAVRPTLIRCVAYIEVPFNTQEFASAHLSHIIATYILCGTECTSSELFTIFRIYCCSSILIRFGKRYIGAEMHTGVLYLQKHCATINLLRPTGHVMHHQCNIQQLYVLPTLYLCVLYLSENKQRLVPLTA